MFEPSEPLGARPAYGLTSSSFTQLTTAIDFAFQESDGRTQGTQSHVEMRDSLLSVMRNFRTDPAELAAYALSDEHKPYTRNLILTTPSYTLLLLCWSPSSASSIHDHPAEACILMPLVGTLKEERFDWPVAGSPLTTASSRTAVHYYLSGQPSYISDDVGLHRIINPRKYEQAVSLHLYYPPFAQCQVWVRPSDGDGSQLLPQTVTMGVYSVRGLRTPHLEGRPSLHGRVMLELKATVRQV